MVTVPMTVDPLGTMVEGLKVQLGPLGNPEQVKLIAG
jgi:hypothetical protein